MKSMIKVLTRYVLSASGIALILLVLNLILLIAWLVQASETSVTGYRISEVAESLTRTNGVYQLSAAGQEALDQRYSWAMLLDANGRLVWSENLPEDVPHQYTVADVAAFTRWYLKDYPVYVWRYEDGLLVLGNPKNSRWKSGLEMPEVLVSATLAWIPAVIALNALAAVLLALLFGLRHFLSLRTLAHGIEDLAGKKAVKLPTAGPLGDLARKLNQTSARLQEQEQALQKRDNARTTWIAGVSHDIRTPLSMILGYASQLEESPHLTGSELEQARIIRQQSEKIKALVNDLNLASRLEYDMQPLQIKELYPAVLLRSLAADFLNNSLDERFSIDLQITPAARENIIFADEKLLWRALSNLINNSVLHNPGGVAIQVTLDSTPNECLINVNDNGTGFSQEILAELQSPHSPAITGKRGLGLTIVQQIIKVHKGSLRFSNRVPQGCAVNIRLPLMDHAQ